VLHFAPAHEEEGAMFARCLVLLAVLSLAACREEEPEGPVYTTVDPYGAGLSGQPACIIPPQGPYTGDCRVGAEQYALVCTACHGVDGNTPEDWTVPDIDPPPPPSHDLSDTAYMGDLDDRYLYTVIKCGGLAVGKSAYMPSWFSAMGEDQLKGLVCYVRELSGT
jgi:mono/diheme cytochrome c family protein